MGKLKSFLLGEDMTFGQWILHVIQGMLVGGGAILPGISGGVLLVTFGIYRPMMELLSHPFKAFPKFYRLFIPFILGWALGFVIFAKVLSVLFALFEIYAICLFVGLIMGTLPQLFRDAQKEGSGNGSWIGFALSITVVFSFLYFLNNGIELNITAQSWSPWFAFCGLVWGLSMVVPGLSSSSILIFVGLYEQMTDGIASLDLGVIIPLIAGVALTVILLARLVNGLFEKFNSIACHAVNGVVIASTLLIIPKSYVSFGQAAFCFICFAVGFFIAVCLDMFGEKIKAKKGIAD